MSRERSVGSGWAVTVRGARDEDTWIECADANLGSQATRVQN